MGHTQKKLLTTDYVHAYITILVDGAQKPQVTVCLCSPLYNHPGRWGTHTKKVTYNWLCSPLYNHPGRWGTNKPSYLQPDYVHPYITILVDGAQKKQVTYNLLMFHQQVFGDLFTLTNSRKKMSLKAQGIPLVICWFVTVWNYSVSWWMRRCLTVWKMTGLITGPKSHFLSFQLLKMCWNFIIFVILISVRTHC